MGREKNHKILKFLMVMVCCLVMLGGNVLESQAASVATPKLESVKAKQAESLTISWKQVKGATGYQVYQSTAKNGKYKKVATISKAKTTTYVAKKLKADTVYYYKINAFKKKNGKKVVSGYSKIKSAQPYPKTVTVSPSSKPYKNNYVKNKSYNSKTKQYYMLTS